MRYTRRDEVVLYLVGLGGFLGLLLAGSLYHPGETWLRDAALVWFLGFGLMRALILLTVGREGAGRAGTSAADKTRAASPGQTIGLAPSSSEPGRPWG